MGQERTKAILTIDTEDYRQQYLQAHIGGVQPSNPSEVERQITMMLELLDHCDASATFFCVGRLAKELPASIWQYITAKHRVGCHGHEHTYISKLGPKQLEAHLHKAKIELEEACSTPVISFRAPFFSCEGCDPWFGEILSKHGFKLDSSKRIQTPPDNFSGTMFLEGSRKSVIEVPLASIGYGIKRLTIIGGTYFRLLPFPIILSTLKMAEKKGFIPMIYLHNYDIDPTTDVLEYPKHFYWIPRLADWMRRANRISTKDKLRKLNQFYEFHSMESTLQL